MSNRSPHNFAHGRLAAVLVLLALSVSSGAALASDGHARSERSQETSLSIGSTGSTVKAVQRVLHVQVTGYFGDQTAAAVRRFQRRRHLRADGVVNAATARALGVRLSKASYASGGASAGSSQGSTVKVPAKLRRIAKCESGGNPRAVSPDGRFRGKYQFDRATWRSLGGRGDPAAAPESEQDRRAVKLYRQRGTAPWPNCA
ncbi:MAG TPA: transglycosylase family protein [Thermoleophilaceae bacterium]|jgi:hypothetical protein